MINTIYLIIFKKSFLQYIAGLQWELVCLAETNNIYLPIIPMAYLFCFWIYPILQIQLADQFIPVRDASIMMTRITVRKSECSVWAGRSTTVPIAIGIIVAMQSAHNLNHSSKPNILNLQCCKLRYRGANGAKESPDSTEHHIPLTAGRFVCWFIQHDEQETVPQKITVPPQAG